MEIITDNHITVLC